MDIVMSLVILLAGLAGSWYHWTEVHWRGDAGSFVDYFFISNTDGSKSAATAFFAAMQTAYIAGEFNGLRLDAVISALMSGQFYQPLVNAVIIAFGIGYICDSKLNSGRPSPNVSAPIGGAQSQPESQS